MRWRLYGDWGRTWEEHASKLACAASDKIQFLEGCRTEGFLSFLVPCLAGLSTFQLASSKPATKRACQPEEDHHIFEPITDVAPLSIAIFLVRNKLLNGR